MIGNVFFWTVITIGMIAFPLVMLVFKGDFKSSLIKGCVFGISYSTRIYINPEEDDDSVLQIHGLSFYLFFISITMAFSVRRDDLEVTDDGE
jgi:hypothetical protein